MKIAKSIEPNGGRRWFLPALINAGEFGQGASATPHAVTGTRVTNPLFRVLAAALVVTGLLAAGTQSHAAAIDLGSAGDFDVLGLSGATINLSSGPLRINGNVGIGQNGTFNFSGGGQVSGVLDADPTATVNISGGGTTVAGGVVRMSMAGIQNAALAEATSAASLTPTQTFSSITSPETITGDGGLNVLSVSQDIHLSGGNLVLSGGPSDTFIFNISGTMELSGGSDIELSGGLQASQVLFNFLGTGSQVQTSGNADTAGIFLAPDRVININGGTHIGEFISGETLSFQSNPTLQPVPEASTWIMLASALCAVILFRFRAMPSKS